MSTDSLFFDKFFEEEDNTIGWYTEALRYRPLDKFKNFHSDNDDITCDSDDINELKSFSLFKLKSDFPFPGLREFNLIRSENPNTMSYFRNYMLPYSIKEAKSFYLTLVQENEASIAIIAEIWGDEYRDKTLDAFR